MMIFLLFLRLLSPTPPLECSSDGMWYFPEQREISLEPLFIIHGYSFSQKTIESFKYRQVYLETSEGERVPLRLQELLKGQMRITQAIFRPETPLAASTQYYLKVGEAEGWEQQEFTQWNNELGEYEDVYWETSDLEKQPSLNKDLRLVFEKTQVDHYGCGPAVYALFDIQNDTAPEILYKTELVAMDTGEMTTFYLTTRQDKLQVGHGMCSGAFTYFRKGKYRVRFTPMTSDGQQLQTTEWMSFRSPFEGADNPWGVSNK